LPIPCIAQADEKLGFIGTGWVRHVAAKAVEKSLKCTLSEAWISAKSLSQPFSTYAP
jgi:hypothetical protein